MKKIKSLPLFPGAKIGIVAPASPLNYPDAIVWLDAITSGFYERGYKVKLGETVNPSRKPLDSRYLSGADSLRQADLERMFLDKSVDAVWCLRGGYGTLRLLPRLCFRFFAESPKILIGFSDITALALGLWSGIKMITFHGPVLTTLQSDFSLNQAFGMLTGEMEGSLAWPKERLCGATFTTIRPGKATGTLIGGNLTTLCSLIGTRFLPNLDGAILFLEEVLEAVYRIDRLLTQLILSGVVDCVAAILVGRCVPFGDETEPEIIAVFTERLSALNCPSAYGYPIGHITEQWTLPQGILAEADTQTGEVILLESPLLRVKSEG